MVKHEWSVIKHQLLEHLVCQMSSDVSSCINYLFYFTGFQCRAFTHPVKYIISDVIWGLVSYQFFLNQPLSTRQNTHWSGPGMCPGNMYNIQTTLPNPQPSWNSLCCSMCTSVTPQETFTNDPAADPWATALCTHLPLGGPSPQGEVSCMPAQIIQTCQETAGFVERQLCDLFWWAHTVYITPSCAVKSWYSVIYSSSGLLWPVLPGHSRLTLSTCADIFDNSTLFGLSMVTVMGIWAENTTTLWTVCLKLLRWPSLLWLFLLLWSKWSRAKLVEVSRLRAPGCHTSDDSLLPTLKA